MFYGLRSLLIAVDLTVVLINEYECVDPVYPLHIPTNNFPTVSLDQLTVILPLECCIMMLIDFYIARPTYCFILVYTCGLTVVIKRICYHCYVICYGSTERQCTASRTHGHTEAI